MKITTKQLTFVSVLSAIYVVLSLLSIESNDFKFSVESLAVLIGSFTLGPLGGFLIGIVGEFVHQLIGPYGLDPTTVLWLMPYALEGLFAGLLVKKNIDNLTKKKIITVIIPSELILTILVTLVNWVSAIIQGWGSWPVIAAAIPFRLAITAVRIVLYIFIIPLLYNGIKKVIK